MSVPTHEDWELVNNAKEDFLAAQNDLLVAWGEAKNRCGGLDYTILAPGLWSNSNKIIHLRDPNSEASILNNWIADFEEYNMPSVTDIVDRINGNIMAMNNLYTQVVSLRCPPGVSKDDIPDSMKISGKHIIPGITPGVPGTTSGGVPGTTSGGVPGTTSGLIIPGATQGGLGLGLLAALGILGYVLYDKYGKKSKKRTTRKRKSVSRSRRVRKPARYRKVRRRR
jgi:hypothetical protein